MRRRLPLVFIALSACTATGEGVERAQLDELSAQLDEASQGIERIEQHLAAIDAKLERLDQAGAAPPAPPILGEDRPPPIDPAKLEGKIRCEGERCTIERALFEELLANPAGLSRSVRLVPALGDGRVQGYKLFTIRPNTVPAMLGLQNGDLAKTVAGRELTSLDVVMDIYSQIQTASEIEIGLERKGEAKRLVIAIE